ncbi:MAG: winged helix-turn-helix domain-containing protein [Desulfuromonadaceae bacterium]|nr:winged helix-turn-helix domain-containing protein [Desulfuromonadaceae bacterium]
MSTKTDSRKLPDDAREVIRREIIRLRSQGISNKDAASTVGVSTRHANMVWKNYLQEENMPLFVWQRRGRRKGEQRSITYKQELQLLSMLLKGPVVMRLGALLWTRQLFQKAIKRRLKCDVPIRTVGEYLKRWGLIPQRPFGLSGSGKSLEVQSWVANEYQEIVKRANHDGGEIHWLSVQNLGGFTAKIYDDLLSVKKRNATHVVASITSKGQIKFMLSCSGLSSEVSIEFMFRLANDTGRKVYLLADKEVSLFNNEPTNKWLQENCMTIEVLYLP